MEQIVAVYRNHFGEIISFQTSEGRVISYQKALQEVEKGQISGVALLEENDVITLHPLSKNDFDDYPTIY
ncbi:DUF3892 domain-containing protein [Bacillus sp. 03113]|uniref:DUF3892 domain-containing protein n=1 Tax=Bacillus sp. 03113 TaxID=2578211 RepID=UPI00114435AF|nr:DUF3892 domain-containing protein [Bacillus sp. 03113]